jgi:hypothetical protein
MSVHHPLPLRDQPSSPRLLRTRAWLSLLLYPFSFAAAFVVGEGLADLFGYPAGGNETPPVPVLLAASVPALVVFALPAAVATYFSRRAARNGEPAAWWPAFLAIAIAVNVVVVTVVAYAVGG